MERMVRNAFHENYKIYVIYKILITLKGTYDR